MIHRLEAKWRTLRRWLSRSEWGIRWLKLSKTEGAAAEPGLLMIQIDGLSRVEFERAIREKRMPFLRKLIKRDLHEIHDFYSGLPSTTPAVQGEIFYGQRTVVPAFSFRDRESGHIVEMLDPNMAEQVEQSLRQKATGLLDGGSAYTDIYTGGAAEPHWCAATVGWGNLLRGANPVSLMALILWNAWSVLRAVVYTVVELVVALGDVVKGLFLGKTLWYELKYLPRRVLAIVVLREVAVIGASMDVTRGLPIVHFNLVGYDEQAHHRGPSSKFAHWSLTGIDDAIARVWRAARRSERRDYELWVYGDHGQERTVPYDKDTGLVLEDAIAAVFKTPGIVHVNRGHGQRSQFSMGRAAWLWGRRSRTEPTPVLLAGETPDTPKEPHLQLTAVGPLGFLYPENLEITEPEQVAQRLVRDAKIPMVLMATGPKAARAWTDAGVFDLPDQAEKLFGADHPFVQEMARDLVVVCHHPEAGKFVLSGWRRGGTCLSFVHENGSHGGPGAREIHAFALLPEFRRAAVENGQALRPAELRALAMQVLGREPLPERKVAAAVRKADRPLRLVTYNVHSCVGLDGKLSPKRIARVLARLDPDIIALQELDVGRERTLGADQAELIAHEMSMDFHFHAAWQLAEERFGNAVLSRLPMRLHRAGGLPSLSGKKKLESRGALWVAIDVDGQELHVINTHLGLSEPERAKQVEALLGPEWLGHPDCVAPRILCGDFNAMPHSASYRRLAVALGDAQCRVNGQRPRCTFYGRFPFARIDHLFVSETLEIAGVKVPRAHPIHIASDHLPLVVDLRLPKAPREGPSSIAGAMHSVVVAPREG